MTTPYVPYLPSVPSPLRSFYSTVAQVLRLNEVLQAGGGMVMTWNPLTAVVDPILDLPGLLACRIDLTFLRPGKDQPAPFVAGRAQDRVGVAYFDLAASVSGIPYILAGDRLECVSGPIFGTFEIRNIPDVAQDGFSGHHVEVQVIEVSQALQPGSPTPFPGGAP